MKVLITGGAGFIGKNVAQAILLKGHQVRIMDVVRPAFEGAEVFLGSILDRHAVLDAVEGCDAVIHLAAMLGVRKTDTRRLRCLNVNVEGSINVFDACATHNINKIIFSSSSEIYGESGQDQISELTPVNPKSVYAVSKIAAEEYLRAYGLKYGLNYSIIRFFNVYGEAQVAEFVMSRFIKMATQGIPLTIYGSGKQVRSFCHVSDAAEGVSRVLTNDKTRGEVFNIGNDKTAISINELAHMIIEETGGMSKVNYVEMQDSDRESSREIHMRRPDISKATRILGYEPVVTVREGVQRMIKSADSIPESWFEPLTTK